MVAGRDGHPLRFNSQTGARPDRPGRRWNDCRGASGRLEDRGIAVQFYDAAAVEGRHQPERHDPGVGPIDAYPSLQPSRKDLGAPRAFDEGGEVGA